MPKKLSGKYYQENKGRLQKKLVKDIKNFLKKTKKESDNMFINITKISQKMKKTKLVKYWNNIIEWEKTLESKRPTGFCECLDIRWEDNV